MNREVNVSVNSCIRPLCLSDGQKITTIESLGDVNNLGSIQKKIVENSGTQCGFCKDWKKKIF